MDLLSKSDLKYKYSWTAYQDDDPKVTGSPDSTRFNRKEGYEVLYLINKFAAKHKLKQKVSGHKIEKMLHEALPGTIQGQENVMAWLKKAWSDH